MTRVVIAGGTGTLGRRIAADLAGRGAEVVVLTRSPRPDAAHRQVGWDGKTAGGWADELRGAVLVNLAGELVDRPPTPANVDLLTRSRVEPTRALAEAAAGLDDPPALWIQAGTTAIYGDRGDTVLDESAVRGLGPPQMTGVASAWEQAAELAPAARQVVLRMSLVLDRDTPALNRLSGVVRAGLGGRIGSGRQWVSWLHVADLLAIVRRCIDDPSLSGMYVATAPNPVTNAELMAALRKALRRPPAPPTPAALVRLGSVVLRTDPALALTGRRCVPTRLLESGFSFAHPELKGALADLLG